MQRSKVSTLNLNLFGKAEDDEDDLGWSPVQKKMEFVVKKQDPNVKKQVVISKNQDTEAPNFSFHKPLVTLKPDNSGSHLKAKSLCFEENATVDFTGVKVKGLENSYNIKDLKISEDMLPKHFNQEKSFSNVKFSPGSVIDFNNVEIVGVPSIKDNIITPQNRNTAYIIEDSTSITSLITNILITGKTTTENDIPAIAVQLDLQCGREYIIEATATVKDYKDTPSVKVPLPFNIVYAYCAASSHMLGTDVVPHGNEQFWVADKEIFPGVSISVSPLITNKLAIIIQGLKSKTLNWWYTIHVTGNGSVSRIVHLNNQKA
jgi:hypothetical protein